MTDRIAAVALSPDGCHSYVANITSDARALDGQEEPAVSSAILERFFTTATLF